MGYAIKVLFADNIGNQYLKHDYLIDGGSNYVKGDTTFFGEIPVVAPAYTKNSNLLLFQFLVVDVDTRSYVPFIGVGSLSISNDPNFATAQTLVIQPASSGPFSAWYPTNPNDPNAHYNSNNLYVVNVGGGGGSGDALFDSIAYTGTSYSGDFAGYNETTLPPGYFGVDNWQLSANGGVSTVYFKVTLTLDPTVYASGVTTYNTANWVTVNYPDSVGGFSQILWQSERTPTPGVPEIYSLSKNLLIPPYLVNNSDPRTYTLYTGATTAWRFRASLDNQTGVYQNGISKYIGDMYSFNAVYALKSSGINQQPNNWSSKLGTIDRYRGVSDPYDNTLVNYDENVAISSLGAVLAGRVSYRTVAPLLSATQVAFNNSVQVVGFSGGEPSYGSTISSPPTPTTQSTEYRFNSSVPFPVTSTNKDAVVQAAFKFTNLPISLPIETWCILSLANPQTTSIYFKTTLSLNSDGSLNVTIERVSSTTVTDSINFRINENLTSKLATGFLLEMYVQQLGNGEVIIKSYATDMTVETPIGSVQYCRESVYLGAFVCTGWGTNLYTGNLYAETGFYLNGSSGSLLDCAVATGSFVLDADLGDCRKYNYVPHSFPSTITDGNSWGTQLNGWNWFTYDDLGDPSTTANQYEILGTGIVLNSCELVATNSTFSKKFEVNVQATFVDGINPPAQNFYIGVSNQTPNVYAVNGGLNAQEEIKFIERLNLAPGGLGLTGIPDTLAVVFDQVQQIIYIQQMLSNGYVDTQTIAPFNPKNDGETWSVEFDFLDNQEAAPQLQIILRRKQIPLYGGSSEVIEQEGFKFIGNYMTPALGGLGYYVAVGSTANVTLNCVTVQGLPQVEPYGTDSSALSCQFIQGSYTEQEFKAIAGQGCYSSLNDEDDYLFVNPVDQDNPSNWLRMTLTDIVATDPTVTTANIGEKFFIGSAGPTNSGTLKVVGPLGTLVIFTIPVNTNYYVQVPTGSHQGVYKLFNHSGTVSICSVEDYQLSNLPTYAVDHNIANFTIPGSGDPHPTYTDGSDTFNTGDVVLVTNQSDSTQNGVYTLSLKSSHTFYVNKLSAVNAKEAIQVTDVTQFAQDSNSNVWVNIASFAGYTNGDTVVIASIVSGGWAADTSGHTGGITYADDALTPGIYVYNSTGYVIDAVTYYLQKLDTMFVESAISADNANIFESNNVLYLQNATNSSDNPNLDGSALTIGSTCLLYGGTVNTTRRGVYVLIETNDFETLNALALQPVTIFEELIRNDNLSTDLLVADTSDNEYFQLSLKDSKTASVNFYGYYSPYVASTGTISQRAPRTFNSLSTVTTWISIVDLATTTDIDITANISTVDNMPVYDKMIILVKDQTNSAENDLYQVTGSENAYTLNRLNYFGSNNYTGRTITVNHRMFKADINAGGYLNNMSMWYYKPLTNTFKRNGIVICQRVSLTQNAISSVLNVDLRLLEVKARFNNPIQRAGVIKARFYSDNNHNINAPLSAWSTAGTLEIGRFNSNFNQTQYTRSNAANFRLGSLVANNNLIQFNFDNLIYNTISNSNDYIWVAIDVPEGADLLSAYANIEGVLGPAYPDPVNSSNFNSTPSHSWCNTQSLWHNLYRHYSVMSSNSVNGADIQTRVLAESQARYRSFASNISNDALVDLNAPAIVGDAPLLQECNGEVEIAINVSATQLLITAQKATGSPILAFRVIKQIDDGINITGPWMPWVDYLTTESNVAQYSVFHNGTWNKTKLGIEDTSILNQNFGFDNARSVKVQIIDYVGNVTTSNKIIIHTGHYALLDTNPPVITGVQFIDQNSVSVPYYSGNYSPHMILNAYDVVSDIKDFRIRPYNNENPPWSNWQPIVQLVALTEDYLAQDGISRVEIQLRDYGNNITQKTTNVDMITDAAQQSNVISGTNFIKLLFNKLTRYTYLNNDYVYIAGIQSQTYTIASLLSASTNSLEYTAYDINSQPVLFRTTDYFNTVTFNSVAWTRSSSSTLDPSSTTFYIDNTTGNILLSQALNSGTILTGGLLNNTSTINLIRDSAVIYQWNNQQLVKVVDLGSQGERCVLSLLAINGTLFIGGSTGRVWTYDTRRLSAPVFIEPNGLPITVLWLHQFQHEPQSYVYIGTACDTPNSINARLYRSPIQLAAFNYGWTPVTFVNGNASLPANVDYTCAVSAYNYLFLGTSNQWILRYARNQIGSAGFVEQEYLFGSQITNANIGYNIFAGDAETPDTTLPIYDMKTAGNMVLATIENKPEIWAYSQEFRKNVLYNELWSKVNFNRDFIYDPAPWQFYGTAVPLSLPANTQTLYYHSNTRNNANINWTSISDSNAVNGYREAMIVNGVANQYAIFTLGTGSDWEQVMRPIDNVSPSKYTLDLEIMQVTGNGHQGIEISDGNYNYNIQFSSSNLVLTSGSNVRIINLDTPNLLGGISNTNTTVSMLSIEPNLQYPQNGTQYLWNFAKGTDREDRGPYWIGGPYTTGNSTDVWLVTNEATLGTIIETETTDTMIKDSNSLLLNYASATLGVNPILYTDFNIANPTLNTTQDPLLNTVLDQSILQYGMQIDTQSKVLIRVKVPQNVAGNLNNQPQLRMTWSHEDTVDVQGMSWIEQDLELDGQYHTYVFAPAWSRGVKFLAFEFVNCPQGTFVDAQANPHTGFAAVDYIAVTSRVNFLANPNFASVDGQTLRNYHESLTSLRIARDGARLRVWLGQSERPLIDENNLLVNPTANIEIKIGKTYVDPNESNVSLASNYSSAWMYGTLKFIQGYSIPPITRDIYDFKLAWRLPSVAAAKSFAYQGGTICVMTDGMGITNNRFMNPDDNMVKSFLYQADKQAWIPQPVPQSRLLENGLSIVAVYDAIGYQNSVIFVGEQGNISYA